MESKYFQLDIEPEYDEEEDYEEEEEDDSKISFDDYLANRSIKKPDIPLPATPTRKKESDSLYSKFFQKTKNDDDDIFEIDINKARKEAKDVAESFLSMQLNYLGMDKIIFRPTLRSQVIQWVQPKMKGVLPPISNHTVNLIGRGLDRKLIVIGGNTPDKFNSAVYLIDIESNTINNFNVPGNFNGLAGHSTSYDQSNQVLYVIGGYNRSGQYNSVHIFNLGKEIPFNEKDFHWNERHEGNPRLAYYQNDWRRQTEHVEKEYCGCSPTREEFKGRDRSHPKETYYHSHFALTLVEGEFPATSHHTATLFSSSIYVFGGRRGNVRTNNIWALNIAPKFIFVKETYWVEKETHNAKRRVLKWTNVSSLFSGAAPSPRSGHTATLVNGSELFIIGGSDRGREYNDVYILDLNQKRWKKPKMNGISLPTIYGHSCNLVGENLILFGGFTNGIPLNHIFLIDIKTMSVSQLSVGGVAPSPRGSHCATLVDERIYLTGGHDGIKHQTGINTLDNVFDTNSYLSTLGYDLTAAIDNKNDSDLKIIFPKENKLIFAHKIILCARSKVFYNQFTTSSVNELIVQDESYDAWKKLLEYIYSDAVELSAGIVSDLIKLSEKYQLQQLEVICKSTLERLIIPPSSFNSDMATLINNKLFSDIVFEVEGKILYSHRVIVSARCPYFKSMFNSKFKEADQKVVPLEDIDFEVFSALLRFLVTDELDSNPQINFELLCHANMFDLKNMGIRCETNLIKYVDESNVCLLLDGAALVNAEELKEFCFSFISRHYYDVRETDAFKQIRQELMKEINERLETSIKYRTKSAPLPPTIVKKDKCDCGLPFVYKPQEWEGETPKYLLSEWYKKNHPKSTPKYEPYLSTKQIGHFTKVTLTHTADAGKPIEIINKVASKTKKESEQNAALSVLHYFHTVK